MRFILNLLSDCLQLSQDLESLFPFFCVYFIQKIPCQDASLIRLDLAYLVCYDRSQNLFGMFPVDQEERAEEKCEVTLCEQLLSASNIYDNLMLIACFFFCR